ncbi:MAG: helix-turn-helix transcriptional regulator [Clostridia bacterium]|nr:helix-turn-helix transcriptional regulator [Clostridia bacterium]
MDIIKIGTFIKEQRIKLNMTQKELADKIGCTDKAISRWETGKGLPDMSFLIPLSKELKVSVNELLAGERIIPEEQEHIEIEKVNEIIHKNDENIISVIEENQKKVKRHTNSFFKLFILFCMQSVVLFVAPNFIPDTFEPLVLMIVLSAVIYVFVGLSKTQLKWLFPVAVALLFTSANPFDMGGDGFIIFLIGLYFATGAYAIIAACTLTVFLVKKLRDVISQKK